MTDGKAFASSGVPAEVEAAFGEPWIEVERISKGLIHRTFRVCTQSGRVFALQAVNPIFSSDVMHDMEATTAWLEHQGLRTPRLVHTVDGALSFSHAGECWRLLTWLDGATADRVESPAMAHAAARYLATFHRAFVDFDYRFRAQRLGVHDTARHRAALHDALVRHSSHRLFRAVSDLSGELLRHSHRVGDFASMKPRVVHGDPKITNVLFDAPRTHAIAMLDLDTVGPMAVALELGDAARSWCNANGEDARDGVAFDRFVLRALVEGYADGAPGFLSRTEVESLVHGIATIIFELCARFLADALVEGYFGFDEKRFASRGEHNLTRAKVQLLLLKDFVAQWDDVQAIVAHTFSSHYPT